MEQTLIVKVENVYNEELTEKEEEDGKELVDEHEDVGNFDEKNGNARNKSLVCKFCSLTFSSRTTYQRHWRSEHGFKVGHYPCAECDHIARTFATLKKHIKSDHSGMRKN